MPETDNIEYKREWRDDFLRVICAFANSEGGGTLYIGREDNGDDSGVSNAEYLLENLPNKINTKLGIIPEVSLLETGDKKLVTIKVSSSSVPVSYQGRYYQRSGSVVLELQGKQLSDFLLKKAGLTWDSVYVDQATMADIDLETIDQFREFSMDRLPSIKREKKVELLLEKLNLLDSKGLKRAAVLLFGKNVNRFFPQAHVRIGRFISESEIIASDIVEGNLFRQLEGAFEILQKKYLINKFHFEGLHRRELSVYPPEALREGLINAIIHRDYNSTAATQVRIYNDKLMILNDGTLPEGITIGDLKRHHLSKPRHLLLADIFYKAGFIESWGSGTLKIIDFCKKAGLKEPDFNQEGGGFWINFYMEENVPENAPENVPENVPENRLEFIVSYMERESGVTLQQLAKECKVNIKTIKRDIEKLKTQGLIKRIGPDKGGYWKVVKKS